MPNIHPFYVRLDNGTLGPAWTMAVALEAAYEARCAGRSVLKIEQAGQVIICGTALLEAINVRCPPEGYLMDNLWV